MVFAADAAFLAGLGAILMGVAGILTAWAGLIAAKRKAAETCEEKLKAARLEAEEKAAELHKRRMEELE